MKAAAISKLKATLSEYIGFVKAGEEVLVTERGKAVAKIVPVDDASAYDAKRMEMIKRGILRPGKGRISPETLKGLPLVSVPKDRLRAILDEEREDRA